MYMLGVHTIHAWDPKGIIMHAINQSIIITARTHLGMASKQKTKRVETVYIAVWSGVRYAF